ncbi:MAG: FeoB-associated Cys-rich membrane protein [Clostridia bacterium]|nr:FeoB-associated Cys-rich membrane protein [Clostridia bacterium]
MNISTLIVLAVIVIISGTIIARGIINKKRGKSSCSCGCGGCAMADVCHKNRK